MNETTNDQLFHTARNLLSGSFQAVLSTHSLDCAGFPFGSALPYCLGQDGWPLLLISHLAKHTRNLLAAPECSLTMVQPGNGDLQQRHRLTLLGRALPWEQIDRHQAERYFRYFPDSRAYWEELSFKFFKLHPERAYFVGGFGAARWVGVDRLGSGNPFGVKAERAALRHLNGVAGKQLYRLLPAQPISPTPGEAKVAAVGIDGDGLDLRRRDILHRIRFPARVTEVEQAMSQLNALLDPPSAST